MALVRFTQNIQRHVTCPTQEMPGDTVRAVLDAYFQAHPQARGYVLDDRAALRQHMAVFVDGTPVADRRNLSDAIGVDTTIDVIQALSGG